MKLDEVNELQANLVTDLAESGRTGKTIVAYALAVQAVVSD
jgi:hypothetical protein